MSNVEAREVAPVTPASGGSGALVRNSLWNLLGLGTPLLLAVFAIPPILNGLGPERFGVLGLIWVGLAYLALLDLGLGRATTRYAADALARGRTDELSAIAWSVGRIQLVVGVLGSALVLVLVPTLVDDLLRISPAVRAEAVPAFMIMAATAPVVILTNTFRGLLEAAQRFGTVNAIRVPVSASNFVVPLAGVWLGWSLGTMAAVLLVVRLLALGAYARACLITWPELLRRARRSAASSATTRGLLGFGGWLTVSSLVSPVLVYGDRFVIGSLISMTAVGFYTLPHEVVTRLEVFPASLAGALFPAFSASLAGGRDDRSRRAVSDAFMRSVKAMLCIVAPILIMLAVVAPAVLLVWLGAEARASVTPLRLLAIGMILNSIAYVPHALLHAAGRPDLTARFHLLELPLHLLMLVVFVNAWGIAGAALAWALRAGLDNVLLLGAVARLRLIEPGRWRADRLPALLAGLVVLAAVLSLGASMIESAAAQVAFAGVLLVAWGVGAWTLLLGADERAELRGALARRSAA